MTKYTIKSTSDFELVRLDKNESEVYTIEEI